VRLVYIDQYSLGWVERNLGLTWPWPRELYGLIAEFGSSARAQAFDILFTEPSPYGPEDDRRCAEAMDRAGNVVLAEVRDPQSRFRLSPLPVTKVRFGSVNAETDPDGLVRRYRLEGEGGVQPFGIAALETGGFTSLQVNALKGRGDPFLRFSGPSPGFAARNAAEIISSAISLREGLTPQTDPREYEGSILFVGFSAPGLLDLQATPVDAAMPGAEIHATFAANALEGSLLEKLPWWTDWIFIIILACAAGFAASFLHRPIALVSAAALSTALPLLAGFSSQAFGLVLASGSALLASLGSFVSGIVLSYVAEGRHRAFLRRSFSQYLSPAVIDELLRHPERLSLGGESRELSVFFSDIEGFTPLSESLPPQKLAEFMNLYLSILTSEILAEGGTVDKYVGDAVVAFWNAPLDQADHAVRAVRAALRCQDALCASAARFAALGVKLPVTRIGIHSGVAIVGNMGSPARFNYTALGDVVNTASRLEEANKTTGTKLLVSRATMEAARTVQGSAGAAEFRFATVGPVIVPGKKDPIEVFEPGWKGLSESR
jgi:adenylate cyclase